MSLNLACSRRSDSGVRAKKKASERAGKKRGKTGEEDAFPSLPSFFSALPFALFFAHAPLSERLEQASLNFARIFIRGSLISRFFTIAKNAKSKTREIK